MAEAEEKQAPAEAPEQANSDQLKIILNGEEYDLSKTLTLEEIEELEEVTKLPWLAIDFNEMKVLRRIAFYIERRKNPEATLEQVSRSLTMEAFFKPVQEEDNAPSPARGRRGKSSSASD
jgi:hypothetical protein